MGFQKLNDGKGLRIRIPGACIIDVHFSIDMHLIEEWPVLLLCYTKEMMKNNHLETLHPRLDAFKLQKRDWPASTRSAMRHSRPDKRGDEESGRRLGKKQPEYQVEGGGYLGVADLGGGDVRAKLAG